MTGPDVVIEARVAPSSNRDEISLSDDGRLIVCVKEPPLKGKANRAVIKLLARRLGLPRSAITIESGAASRLKRIRISGGREAFKSAFGPAAEE